MAGVGAVKFKDTIWKRIQRSLKLGGKAAKESHVKVGVLARKGGKALANNGTISLIELAAIHEFGSPAAGIPQRSHIRSTFARPDIQAEMGKLTKGLVTKVIHGMALERALGLLGAWGVSKIRLTITERLTTGPEPQENAPSTLKRKKSTTPLVDTGQYMNSLSWLVWVGANRDARGRFTGGKLDL